MNFLHKDTNQSLTKFARREQGKAVTPKLGNLQGNNFNGLKRCMSTMRNGNGSTSGGASPSSGFTVPIKTAALMFCGEGNSVFMMPGSMK